MRGEKKMIQRNLDGVYFRMKRGDKYMNVCFSDMTEDEQDEVLKGRNEEYLRNFVKILANTIRKIGDELDIVGE